MGKSKARNGRGSTRPSTIQPPSSKTPTPSNPAPTPNANMWGMSSAQFQLFEASKARLGLPESFVPGDISRAQFEASKALLGIPDNFDPSMLWNILPGKDGSLPIPEGLLRNGEVPDWLADGILGLEAAGAVGTEAGSGIGTKDGKSVSSTGKGIADGYAAGRAAGLVAGLTAGANLPLSTNSNGKRPVPAVPAIGPNSSQLDLVSFALGISPDDIRGGDLLSPLPTQSQLTNTSPSSSVSKTKSKTKSNSHPITTSKSTTTTSSYPITSDHLVPVSDKALSMLNHMLGSRGMMQRDPDTGAIDVLLNAEHFPNLPRDLPGGVEVRSAEIPDHALRGGGGSGKEDLSAAATVKNIRDIFQTLTETARKGMGDGTLPSLEDLLKLPIFNTGMTLPTPKTAATTTSNANHLHSNIPNPAFKFTQPLPSQHPSTSTSSPNSASRPNTHSQPISKTINNRRYVHTATIDIPITLPSGMSTSARGVDHGRSNGTNRPANGADQTNSSGPPDSHHNAQYTMEIEHGQTQENEDAFYHEGDDDEDLDEEEYDEEEYYTDYEEDEDEDLDGENDPEDVDEEDVDDINEVDEDDLDGDIYAEQDEEEREEYEMMMNNRASFEQEQGAGHDLKGDDRAMTFTFGDVGGKGGGGMNDSGVLMRGQEVVEEQEHRSILDDPEKLDWAVNALFLWIKHSVDEQIVQPARQARQARFEENQRQRHEYYQQVRQQQQQQQQQQQSQQGQQLNLSEDHNAAGTDGHDTRQKNEEIAGAKVNRDGNGKANGGGGGGGGGKKKKKKKS